MTNSKNTSTKKGIDRIIQKSQILRLAIWDAKFPYIIPVCFGYDYRFLYFHSAKKGKKITLLTIDPHVGFELDCDRTLIKNEHPCKWAMRYFSVVGTGIIHFITDSEEKKNALLCIMNHYSGTSDFQFNHKKLQETEVLKIQIDTMTGKQS